MVALCGYRDRHYVAFVNCNRRSLKGFKVITRYEVPGKKNRLIIPAHLIC
jgi:hypothetical protein